MPSKKRESMEATERDHGRFASGLADAILAKDFGEALGRLVAEPDPAERAKLAERVAELATGRSQIAALFGHQLGQVAVPIEVPDDAA